MLIIPQVTATCGVYLVTLVIGIYVHLQMFYVYKSHSKQFHQAMGAPVPENIKQ